MDSLKSDIGRINSVLLKVDPDAVEQVCTDRLRTNGEDLMSVEEEQQLQSPSDNTKQLEDEEQQSVSHKKSLSDKDISVISSCQSGMDDSNPASTVVFH